MNRSVQTGPVYHCWVCGKPASIIDFSVAMGGPTTLDQYAKYIGYLDLPPECRAQKHPSRIARLGPAITPLFFPDGCTLEERIQAIQEAIVYLTSLDIREETPADRIARIIHLVCTRVISPDEAIRELCSLMEVKYEMPLVR